MAFSVTSDIARRPSGTRGVRFIRVLAGIFLSSAAFAATPPGSIVNNRAVVTYTQGGLGAVATFSNLDQITIAAPATTATLTLTAQSGAVIAGGSTLMNVTVANPSGSPLTSGQITITLPTGATLQSVSGDNVSSSGNVHTLSVADIPANGTALFPVRLIFPSTHAAGTVTVPVQYQAAGTNTTNAILSLQITGRSRSSVEFLQYDPGGPAPPTAVGLTQYADGGGAFSSLAPPVLPGANVPVSAGPVPLAPATAYHKGQIVFVRITEPDHNIDANVIDTVDINLAAAVTGDTEILRLRETGPDTGIFTGYALSTAAQMTPNNGLLSVATNDTLSLRYIDDADQADTATASVLVDPYGMVFSSGTGQPVNGIQVRLIDSDTGQPAVVFGDDGVSAYPATVTTGGTVTDGGGAVHTFPEGRFRFPLVNPGNYRLAIGLPAGSGYLWPSTASTATIQALPGGPFMIHAGSRGEVFTVKVGPPLELDVPVDPLPTPLFVRKTANKATAANGDFLQYSVEVENTASLYALANVEVVDVLPHGFRYQTGSARINDGQAQDPVSLPDGRTLKFNLGTLAPGERASVRYVTEIAVAAPGKAINLASATSNGAARSNTAEAAVAIREDLMRSRSILMGKVIITNPDDADKGNDGLADGLTGVRIYLEDGSFVVTDKRGMFHFEGIRPGTHVVQMDLDTLPEKYEAVLVEDNTRAAGRAWSKFVDVQGGTLWRVDFHVKQKSHQQGNASLTMDSTVNESEQSQDYQLALKNTSVPLRNARLTIMLPEGADYIPGSSRLNDDALPDPTVTSGTLTYSLGNIPQTWEGALRFRARLPAGDTGATLTSKAIFIFDTPAQSNQRTAVAENAVSRIVSEASRTVREFTLRPTFPSLDTTLSATDKPALDELAKRIATLENIHIEVIGHADNAKIHKRSRDRFSDNHSLSLARAQSVAEYLKNTLNLAPEQIGVTAKGDNEPVASNRTEQGRAQNRRVDIRVTADKVERVTAFQGEKSPRTEQAVETKGLRPGEAWPELDVTVQNLDEAPVYDETWLETASPTAQWLTPENGFRPAIPSLNIAIKHAPGDKVILSKDGATVSNLNFDRTIKNKQETAAISHWRGIDLREGDNHFEIVVLDAGGQEVMRSKRTIHYSSPPVRAELVKEQSSLLADGIASPVIAVRLLDRDGHPAREGVTGEFIVNPPYRALAKTGYKTALMPGAPEEKSYYKIGKDGIALIKLDPTTEAGEVRLRLPFSQGAGDIGARLTAKKRDWIIVGFAEGTAGYNVLSGNSQPLRGNAAHELEEHLYQDGRVAFYAKGKIDAKWLMTVAYDSNKFLPPGAQPSLFGTIPPGTYYTLYGDGATQRYDAASARKIYLKIERDTFQALFGDFNTNLTLTELSRYNRSLTGVKSEYNDDRFHVTMFGSQSSQAFKRDEIRGEGTSGLYRLSNANIVLNSEKITLQVRDRFRSEIIVSSRSLARNSHYTINYDTGTLFFREPVFSTDENLNPVFIVVEYETYDRSAQSAVYGGRGAVKIDKDLTVGVTHIHEGRGSLYSDLSGIDMNYQLSPETRARVEYAQSTNTGTQDAYLAQLEHRSKSLDAKAYLRETGDGFGLGQISNAENGTRKMGVEGIYRLFDNASVRGNVYRQNNLATGATRDFIDSQGSMILGDTSLRAGIRSARDTLSTGEKKSSELVTAGITQKVIKDTLSVRADREQPVGSAASVDFPARTRLGADYKISSGTSLFAEQEWANGALRDTQNTRLGVKTTPWADSDLFTAVTQSQVDNTARTLANMGLRQRWKINNAWSMDAGLERGKTLNGQNAAPLNTNVPFASGPGASGDFTAVSAGTTWQPEKWLWNMRLEYRDSSVDTRWNALSSVQTEPSSDLGLLAALQIMDSNNAAGLHALSGNLRLGAAYRPARSKWIVLDKFDLIREFRTGSPQESGSARIVNNMNVNYKVTGTFQVSLQYGAKYVREKIDSRDYSGYTDLMGLEGRYDLNKDWDAGVRGSVLHSWSANQYDSSLGASIGHTLVENMWLSAGYNFTGFIDRDFSINRYTSAGPFVQMRMKFDQQSIRDVVRWGIN